MMLSGIDNSSGADNQVNGEDTGLRQAEQDGNSNSKVRLGQRKVWHKLPHTLPLLSPD